MNWLRRIVIAVAVVAVALVSTAYVTALHSERPVGFQVLRATDADGKPFAVGVWYPTNSRTRPTSLVGGMDVAREAPIAGDSLPLVVISHGNGGGPASHADLAMALASAGYVVAAPAHLGDSYGDESGVGSASLFSNRARQLRETLDQMLGKWQGRAHIDAERIGAFGFSAGGLTVLVAVGAQPDMRRVATHCTASPEFACDVLQHAGSPLLKADAPSVGDAFVSDPRIKAAVVAAPGLGFTLDSTGLAGVQVPIQLWSGDEDDKVPYATNTRIVRDALGPGAEFHSVKGAGHLSFLTPCGPLAPPALCAEKGQFDRKAFHASMDSSVVAFFGSRLPKVR